MAYRRVFRVGRCELCGADIEGGKDECRNIYFGQVLIREYESPECGAVHLLSVDCYALQHSEDHSPRSNAYHLLRLCWVLFGGGSADIGQKDKGPMQFIMEKYYRSFLEIRAPPLRHRGKITVIDMYHTKNAAEHKEMAYRWGRSVWDTYLEHHVWAKQMLKNAGVIVDV